MQHWYLGVFFLSITLFPPSPAAARLWTPNPKPGPTRR